MLANRKLLALTDLNEFLKQNSILVIEYPVLFYIKNEEM